MSLPPASQAATDDGKGERAVIVDNPASELWRNVRQRENPLAGTSQVQGTETNYLMRVSGEAWRQYRTLTLIPRASIAIFVALFVLFLFWLLRGKMKLEAGRSGIKILRFTLNQRVAHWCTAILFVVLALTGLVLLLGRKLLIPLFGTEGFSYIAATAKTLHNYLGPAFAVALIFLIILFVRNNIISPRIDLQWIMKLGGFGKAHVSAQRFNFGEKGWFWIAVLVGSTIVVSGMVLNFPIFGQTRDTMELYLVIHGIAAIIMTIASFGHIYMGTAGVEATFEVMQTGYCDSNWAREHHDLWYEEVKDTAVASAEDETVGNSSVVKDTGDTA
jgi:formate dehydrogenase subunit gamma